MPGRRLVFELATATRKALSDLFATACAWAKRGSDALGAACDPGSRGTGDRDLQHRLLRTAVLVNARDDTAGGSLSKPRRGFRSGNGGLWRRDRRSGLRAAGWLLARSRLRLWNSVRDCELTACDSVWCPAVRRT